MHKCRQNISEHRALDGTPYPVGRPNELVPDDELMNVPVLLTVDRER